MTNVTLESPLVNIARLGKRELSVDGRSCLLDEIALLDMLNLHRLLYGQYHLHMLLLLHMLVMHQQRVLLQWLYLHHKQQMLHMRSRHHLQL